jgi:rubrerythrin
MSKEATVDKLFESAIAAEKAAEALYRGLEAKFAHHQEAADFWKQYAAEEVGHARWLERLRGRLSAEQLAAPADPDVLQQAHRAIQFSVEHALKGVKDLEDAYQLANELENAETNAIFEFLITSFPRDEQTAPFLRAQLKSHVGKIMIEFPTQFHSVGMRRAIKARE